MSNPFFPGKPVPPEHFVGRTSEINFAFDQICNSSHFAIWGGPGMGKTSFLRKLASEQALREHGIDPSEVAVVLLNCQSIIPFTPAGFWQEILNLLHNQLDNEPQLQSEIQPLLEKPATSRIIRQALRKLGDNGKFLLLLVDDFDASVVTNEQYTEAEMETFLAECRSLAVSAEESQYLSMIVTSLQPLSELQPQLNPHASPWYNHYLFQSLKLFTTSELVQILNIVRPPTLRGEIINITGGHPSLVQIAGNLIYQEMQRGQDANSESFAQRFEADTRQIFEVIWQRCNPTEQLLLMLIALLDLDGHIKDTKFTLKGIGIILSQHERLLEKLKDRGVITSSIQDSETFYSFTSPLMKKRATQAILNTSEHFFEENQLVFLNLISHKQLDQVQNFVTWLTQNGDTVNTVLDWIPKLLPFFP
ncbi:ATP-binding protein [Sphaerospermopsis torques-reginae]|uniref:ATP-binding protein n=1 Tax=Sphaerospermopsis torques-reginae ITEP-024 TaxID=984208 RepID=A0ABX8X1E1_9CYAN|nr:ATP-binding protein [Sphaerospermopsis torques-reginae]QYX32450.1 ATP-binding protein [Sphaerospermopsis torques-reginae ITEP-024]